MILPKWIFSLGSVAMGFSIAYNDPNSLISAPILGAMLMIGSELPLVDGKKTSWDTIIKNGIRGVLLGGLGLLIFFGWLFIGLISYWS